MAVSPKMMALLLLVAATMLQIWSYVPFKGSPKARGGVSLLQSSSSLISRGHGRKASILEDAGQALLGWFGFTTYEATESSQNSSEAKKVRKFHDNPTKRQLELALHGTQSELHGGYQDTEWSLHQEM